MKKPLSIILFILLLISVYLANASGAAAHSAPLRPADATSEQHPQAAHSEETLEGRVTEILAREWVTPQGAETEQLYQKLAILVTRGSLQGQTIIVEHGKYAASDVPEFRVGDRLVIRYTINIAGEPSYAVVDYVRRPALYWLLGIFLVLSVLVGRWQGATSLLGLAISFVVIYFFMLPKIYAGSDPVLIAILGSLGIIPATFFLSHGINLKTVIAVLGTVIALVITAMLADIFIKFAHLSGFSSEEAGFLQAYRPDVINIKGLVLAGIIIGVLGILDDITISQAAIVRQLADANPSLEMVDLYLRAMSVGRDHIASMINTLILVYAGAALPLLLLFINNPHPFLDVINYEIVAEEVVRTLVGSIGLIMAVPITTVIAALAAKFKRGRPPAIAP